MVNVDQSTYVAALPARRSIQCDSCGHAAARYLVTFVSDDEQAQDHFRVCAECVPEAARLAAELTP